MKIEGSRSPSINVISTKELGSLFKNIKVGDTISAYIIKNEGNRAVLEIGGKTITAEFTKGVPTKNNIDLILTAKTPERIQFSLADSKAGEHIFRLLSNFSILNDNDTNRVSLQNLARFINNINISFIDINFFLMGIRREKEKERDLPALFNRLLQKGITFQTLSDINFLIYSRLNPLLFFSYQYILNLLGNIHQPQKETGHDLKENLKDFLKVIQEDDSDFAAMFKIFFDESFESKTSGKFVFPEDETFIDLEYLIGEDSIFIKLNFSVIGALEVLIKHQKGEIFISFFTEKDNLIDFMKENDSILNNMLNVSGVKKYNIAYFNSKTIVDKLKVWSLDFYTKSEFNIKA